jgi:hypothetical protein
MTSNLPLPGAHRRAVPLKQGPPWHPGPHSVRVTPQRPWPEQQGVSYAQLALPNATPQRPSGRGGTAGGGRVVVVVGPVGRQLP